MGVKAFKQPRTSATMLYTRPTIVYDFPVPGGPCKSAILLTPVGSKTDVVSELMALVCSSLKSVCKESSTLHMCTLHTWEINGNGVNKVNVLVYNLELFMQLNAESGQSENLFIHGSQNIRSQRTPLQLTHGVKLSNLADEVIQHLKRSITRVAINKATKSPQRR
jgi:hypothetical protein